MPAATMQSVFLLDVMRLRNAAELLAQAAECRAIEARLRAQALAQIISGF